MKENDDYPTAKMFRNIIKKMEEPLMKLVAHQDLKFFTLVDLMEIVNATLANMSDTTCNRFLSGLHEGRIFFENEEYLNSSKSQDQITNNIIDLARIIAGTSSCVLRDVRYCILFYYRKFKTWFQVKASWID